MAVHFRHTTPDATFPPFPPLSSLRKKKPEGRQTFGLPLPFLSRFQCQFRSHTLPPQHTSLKPVCNGTFPLVRSLERYLTYYSATSSSLFKRYSPLHNHPM